MEVSSSITMQSFFYFITKYQTTDVITNLNLYFSFTKNYFRIIIYELIFGITKKITLLNKCKLPVI